MVFGVLPIITIAAAFVTTSGTVSADVPSQLVAEARLGSHRSEPSTAQIHRATAGNRNSEPWVPSLSSPEHSSSKNDLWCRIRLRSVLPGRPSPRLACHRAADAAF